MTYSFYKNSYMQMAFFTVFFGALYSYEYLNSSDSLLISYIAMFFAAIGMFEELRFMSNSKLYVYKDLAKLLIVTKKIENSLEIIGATGGGMYEKAQSISSYLPNGMLEKILTVAETRNSAMHGDSKIKNIDSVLKESKTILKNINALYSFYSIRVLFSKNENIFYKIIIIISSLIKTAMLFIIYFLVVKFAYSYAGVGSLILAVVVAYYLTKYIISFYFTFVNVFLSLISLVSINTYYYFENSYTSLSVYLSDTKLFLLELIQKLVGAV